MMFPEAYAKVCEEESGELCLYTDVEYKACDEAKTSQYSVIKYLTYILSRYCMIILFIMPMLNCMCYIYSKP